MNFYIPKSKIISVNFVNSIKNILFKKEIKTTIIKRRDHTSKTLVNFSKSLECNNFSWITYDKFIQE